MPLSYNLKCVQAAGGFFLHRIKNWRKLEALVYPFDKQHTLKKQELVFPTNVLMTYTHFAVVTWWLMPSLRLTIILITVGMIVLHVRDRWTGRICWHRFRRFNWVRVLFMTSHLRKMVRKSFRHRFCIMNGWGNLHCSGLASSPQTLQCHRTSCHSHRSQALGNFRYSIPHHPWYPWSAKIRTFQITMGTI